MGTLASELGGFAERLTDTPRVYVDANVPAGLVRFMRERLGWDVFSVIEDEGLRRASDIEHFRLAMKLHRTLLTLDQDFLDDRRFPLAECGGVLILSAPPRGAAPTPPHAGQPRAVPEIVRYNRQQTGKRPAAVARTQAARARGLDGRTRARYAAPAPGTRNGAIVILGISADGQQATAVLVEPDGSVRSRAAANQPEMGDAIVEVARKTLASAAGAVPSAVGVSFPDPDPKSWPADLTFLAAAVGHNIPIRAVSTGNASSLAEVWYGAGRGARDLIAFSIGPSVSAGVISNGVLLAGAHSLASSVQWLALNPVERDDYRRLGCLEAEGGAAGIVRRLVWRIKSGDRSQVLDAAGGDFNAIRLDDILKGARDGDGVSISVIRDTVKYLGMAVSNIAAVIDPEAIILGGVLQSAGDLLLEPMRQECARRMPPGVVERTRIELSTLGADCAPIGAARFAQSGAQLP